MSSVFRHETHATGASPLGQRLFLLPQQWQRVYEVIRADSEQQNHEDNDFKIEGEE